jgi:NAD(P)-dependent dehydrogenase (short-subunit alcohol dehydrogenase family)
VSRHVLVVGGTGMLRGVSIHLARGGDVVSVVARTPSRLEALAREAGVNPVCVDWTDAARLEALLRDAVRVHGPLRLAVCWIHSTAREAPFAVARVAADEGSPVPYLQAFGSSAGDAWRRRLSAWPGIRYRRVLLGRVGDRWLTDEEISAGVIGALSRPEDVVQVGEPV